MKKKFSVLLNIAAILLPIVLFFLSFYLPWLYGSMKVHNTAASSGGMVDIKGEVQNPDVYAFSQGDPPQNVIDAAGGLKASADTKKINFSRPPQDGMEIIVPALSVSTVPDEETPSSGSEPGSTPKKEKKAERTLTSPINLNTAPKEDLVLLPGIGEVLASRIIEYRNQTPFTSVDELTNVKGIGEKKLSDVKPYLYVTQE